MGAPHGNRKAATGGRYEHGGKFNVDYLRAVLIARRARMGRLVSAVDCSACRELNKGPTYEPRLREWQEQLARGEGNRKKPPISRVKAHKPHAEDCGHFRLRAQGTSHGYIRTHIHTYLHACMQACIHTQIQPDITSICEMHTCFRLPPCTSLSYTHIHPHTFRTYTYTSQAKKSGTQASRPITSSLSSSSSSHPPPVQV
jgi:hypothetical protein